MTNPLVCAECATPVQLDHDKRTATCTNNDGCAFTKTGMHQVYHFSQDGEVSYGPFNTLAGAEMGRKESREYLRYWQRKQRLINRLRTIFFFQDEEDEIAAEVEIDAKVLEYVRTELRPWWRFW